MNTPESSLPALDAKTVAEEPILPPAPIADPQETSAKKNVLIAAGIGGFILLCIIIGAIFLFMASSSRNLQPKSQSLAPDEPSADDVFATQIKSLNSRLSQVESNEKSDSTKIDQLTQICINYAQRVETSEQKDQELSTQVHQQADQIKELQTQLDSYGGGFRQLPKPQPNPNAGLPQ